MSQCSLLVFVRIVEDLGNPGKAFPGLSRHTVTAKVHWKLMRRRATVWLEVMALLCCGSRGHAGVFGPHKFSFLLFAREFVQSSNPVGMGLGGGSRRLHRLELASLTYDRGARCSRSSFLSSSSLEGFMGWKPFVSQTGERSE
jgi:hypothetical protein